MVAEVMREYAVDVPLVDEDVLAVDMVRTGGDGPNTFDVSKTVAMVITGVSARVIKIDRSSRRTLAPMILIYT